MQIRSKNNVWKLHQDYVTKITLEIRQKVALDQPNGKLRNKTKQIGSKISNYLSKLG